MSEIDQTSIQKLFHLGERTLADLENPVPNLTDASQLADPAILGQFEAVVKKLVETDDGETALLGWRLLEDILLPQVPQLKDAREIYGRYQGLIIILKFINLSVQSLPEIQSLVSQHLLMVMRAGVPVKVKFQRVLDVYDDIMLDGTISEALGKAIQTSTEKLGTSALNLKSSDRPLPPALGNWITDYFQSTLSETGQERIIGPVERISYINQSPNVRQLTKEGRELLLHVLELYDWLRWGDNPALLYRILSQPQTPPPPLRSPARPAVSEQKPVASRQEPVDRKPQETVPPPGLPPTDYRLPKKPLPPPPRPPERPVVSRPETVVRKEQEAKPQLQSPVASRQSPAPQAQPPPRVPRTTSLNEDLYRQTLEELKKMRVQEQSVVATSDKRQATREMAPEVSDQRPAISPSTSPGIKTQSPIANRPPAMTSSGEVGRGQSPAAPSGPADFSVNEAIIHAGSHLPPEDHGEIVPGPEEKPQNEQDQPQ